MTCLVSLALLLTAFAFGDWPQFRGPTGDGVSDATGLPLSWSAQENVVWMAPIAGLGRSSPVVLGERIWLTTAVKAGASQDSSSPLPLPASGAKDEAVPAADPVSLRVVCLDQASGKLLYQVELFSIERPEPVHWLNSYATPTPVVEPGRLYCDFGAYGTACLDMDSGQVLWKTRLAVDHQLGPGSSPAVFRDCLFLVRDGCDAQYVAAVEKSTGRIAWKTDRPPIEADGPAYKKSLSTPLVITDGARQQVVVIGAHWVVSYDPPTGREVWCVRHGKGYSIAPRPVYGHGMVYVCTGDYVAQLWAIRADGQGDVTDTHVAWKATSQIPLMASPLLVGDELYFVSDNGVISCLDARSGKTHWRERVGGNFAASPLVADGRIYFFGREGGTLVLRPGREFSRLAENHLPGTVIASPAVSGSTILLRTDTDLYCIGQAK